MQTINNKKAKKRRRKKADLTYRPGRSEKKRKTTHSTRFNFDNPYNRLSNLQDSEYTCGRIFEAQDLDGKSSLQLSPPCKRKLTQANFNSPEKFTIFAAKSTRANPQGEYVAITTTPRRRKFTQISDANIVVEETTANKSRVTKRLDFFQYLEEPIKAKPIIDTSSPDVNNSKLRVLPASPSNGIKEGYQIILLPQQLEELCKNFKAIKRGQQNDIMGMPASEYIENILHTPGYEKKMPGMKRKKHKFEWLHISWLKLLVNLGLIGQLPEYLGAGTKQANTWMLIIETFLQDYILNYLDKYAGQTLAICSQAKLINKSHVIDRITSTFSVTHTDGQKVSFTQEVRGLTTFDPSVQLKNIQHKLFSQKIAESEQDSEVAIRLIF